MSLHLSECHIVGNHMSRRIKLYIDHQRMLKRGVVSAQHYSYILQFTYLADIVAIQAYVIISVIVIENRVMSPFIFLSNSSSRELE